MSTTEPQPKMKKLAIGLFLAVICVIAYGYIDGWFKNRDRIQETENNNLSIGQPFEQDAMARDVTPAVELVNQPVNSVAE